MLGGATRASLTLLTAGTWAYFFGKSNSDYSFQQPTIKKALPMNEDTMGAFQKITTTVSAVFFPFTTEIGNTYASFIFVRGTLDSNPITRPFGHLFQISAALGLTFVGYKVVTKVALPILKSMLPDRNQQSFVTPKEPENSSEKQPHAGKLIVETPR